MFKQLRKNEKGVIYITVLMIILVMMILVISVISMNVNEVMLAENEVNRIRAEMLAFGMLAVTFANQASNSASNYISNVYIFDGRTYNVTSVVGPATGPYNTNTLTINVSY